MSIIVMMCSVEVKRRRIMTSKVTQTPLPTAAKR
jgi:hypothetical protein